jgi:hypothetical protein
MVQKEAFASDKVVDEGARFVARRRRTETTKADEAGPFVYEICYPPLNHAQKCMAVSDVT